MLSSPEQIQGWEGGIKIFCRLSESRNAARLKAQTWNAVLHVTCETGVCFVKLLLYLQIKHEALFQNC